MKWVEKHWILTIIIVAAVMYLYGNQLLAAVTPTQPAILGPDQASSSYF